MRFLLPSENQLAKCKFNTRANGTLCMPETKLKSLILGVERKEPGVLRASNTLTGVCGRQSQTPYSRHR